MTNTKVSDQAEVRWRKVRKVFIGITPPVVADFIRSVRDRLLHASSMSSSLTVSSKYSTLDNPIEVPCQVECYLFCREKYLKPTDTVLDVGFGLGYGLQIMAAKVEKLMGVEVDASAVARANRIFAGHTKIATVLSYDGIHLPFTDKSIDVVTCIEIIEHVENYRGLLLEMARVARRAVFIATPNRLPENTLEDGSPKNCWHLHEWTKDELEAIFREINLTCDWNFMEGPFEGPFNWTPMPTQETWSLVPVIFIK